MTDVKEEVKGEVVQKLKELNLDPTQYIEDDFLVLYKGSFVDYKEIKDKFVEKVSAVYKGTEEENLKTATKIGIYLNLGGFAKTKKNFIKFGKELKALDDIARDLNIVNRVGGDALAAKRTDRHELTFARIAGSFADETANLLETKVNLVKLKGVGKYGFLNAYLCKDIDIDSLSKLYLAILDMESNWSKGRTNRFSDKVKKYHVLVKGKPEEFFNRIETRRIAFLS
jgi:hypothetical protein